MHSLHQVARSETLAAVGHEVFDIAVVGGGINGAAISLEAARRGARVLLLEKGDFASGTSSRSSRLIHGGIRYLEYGQIGLVLESSREKRLLAALAPHLVRPLAFTWPVYRGARIGLWKLRTGLFVYGMLAGFRSLGGHTKLSREDLLRAQPSLRSDGLLGGARYFDAATDDARLTLANVRAAAGQGAKMLNYCKVIAMLRQSSLVALRFSDELETGEYECRARHVVNASGPWSDSIISLLDSASQPVIHGTKGTHIAVARERVGNNDAVTLLAPADGRVFFALPSGPTTIIGTTDRATTESADEVRASETEIAYLLSAANHYFENAELSRADVIAAWSGIRPLAAALYAGDESSTSREHRLHWTDSAMLSVTGGKLTTYRVVAKDVVRALARKTHALHEKSPGVLRLPGGDFSSVDEQIAAAISAGAEPDVARNIVHSYGSEWRAVWERADEGLKVRIVPGLPYIRAQIVFAVREEMALTIGDVLLRRTHVAFECRDHGAAVAPDVAKLMRAELGWSSAGEEEAVQAYQAEVERVFGVHN